MTAAEDAKPVLLIGENAIARHLDMTGGAVRHRIRERSIPVFRLRGAPAATAGGLDEWRALLTAGKI